MTSVFLQRIFVLSVAFLALPCGVCASAMSNVGGVTVVKDRLNVEVRSGYTRDGERDSIDEQFETRQHIDYGFTDLYAVRLTFTQDQMPGDHLQQNDVRLENRFHFVKEHRAGWDAGMRISYFHENNGRRPDRARIRFIGRKRIGERWRVLQNIFFAHDIGAYANDGVQFESRTRLSYFTQWNNRWLRDVTLGADMFNNIGRLNHVGAYDEQRHQLGVTSNVLFRNNSNLRVMYRRGISNAAPDHTVGVVLGHMF